MPSTARTKCSTQMLSESFGGSRLVNGSFVGGIENTTGPEVYRRMSSRFVSWVFKNADGGDGRFLRTGYAEGKERMIV